MTQGTYSFAGIVDPKEGIYSQSYGTDPDRILLTFTNQAANIAAGGTVTFAYGATSLTLPDCKVDQGLFEFLENGFVEKAILYDRRWRWRLVPKVSLHFNEPSPDGNGVRPITEKTPQEIFTYLFTELGEAVDVTQVPNNSRPEIFVTCNDVVDVIDDLADQLSCRVILGYGASTVTVVPVNHGTALPDDSSISRISVGWDPPEQPRYVEVAFADTIYQSRFQLVPVGQESASPFEIKLLDDLTYTPAGGWGAYANVETFEDLASSEAISAARRSVWRWFAMPPGPYTVPGVTGTVSDRFMIHPLRRTRAVFAVDQNYSQVVPPGIWGNIYVENVDDMEVTQPGSGTNTSDEFELPVSFSLDEDNGIFKFRRPMRKISGNQNADPELIAEVSYHVRNSETFANEAYRKQVEINSLGYGTVTICVNVPRIIIQNYDEIHMPDTITDNQLVLDALAAQVALDFTETLAAYESYVVHYNILRPDIVPTGKIAQVTHIVSDTGGASTIGGQHMEWDTGAKTYVQKQRDRAADALRGAIQQTQDRISRGRYRGDRVA